MKELYEKYAALGEQAEWVESHIGDCLLIERIQEKQRIILDRIDTIKHHLPHPISSREDKQHTTRRSPTAKRSGVNDKTTWEQEI